MRLSAKDAVTTLCGRASSAGRASSPPFELVRTEPPGLVDERGRQMPCTVARPLLTLRGEQLAKEAVRREDIALGGDPRQTEHQLPGLADEMRGDKSARRPRAARKELETKVDQAEGPRLGAHRRWRGRPRWVNRASKRETIWWNAFHPIVSFQTPVTMVKRRETAAQIVEQFQPLEPRERETADETNHVHAAQFQPPAPLRSGGVERSGTTTGKSHPQPHQRRCPAEVDVPKGDLPDDPQSPRPPGRSNARRSRSSMPSPRGLPAPAR